ncbi:indole-3-glycerol phosphate synthase [Ereboglobus sp. PH5-10]|uniref:indole-3-glycerol phosphate synthase TrpC n=1 Tax=Ereboglobus sp. PH5-10 TaxID=2940629 RepID=UPI0024062327|nr:indole-3-glycerol phosphate synthase TrpC [Ereboglobus sp. PH5-10]MDF9826824.1 indole-3-glycerol phosphate synthase [Ereboglobus sp. PH5-10]
MKTRAHILDQIAARTRRDLEEKQKHVPLEKLKRAAQSRQPAPSFADALRDGRQCKTPRVIAELKRASPSAGVIRDPFEPLKLADALEKNGAAALSILTEPHYFEGRLSYLEDIAGRAKIPLLRKDFIVDEYQIHEARAAGASAVLLIARMLDDHELAAFLHRCKTLRLDALCEVHDEPELDRALRAGASIIGINCRNLEDFSMHPRLTENLIQKIPADKIIVAESGLSSAAELRRLQALGADAFLIGTTLMRAQSPAAALEALLKNETEN